jgi:signal transduction histidine kinase
MRNGKSETNSVIIDLCTPRSIGALAGPVRGIESHTLISDVKKLFSGDEPLKAIVVVADKHPIGLVMNIHLDKNLSERFGVALYYNKPIEVIMDVAYLCVDWDTPVEQVADMAMIREKSKIFDDIVITRQGEVAGIVAVQDIMSAMLENQRQNALEKNLINEHLQREIEERRHVQEKLVRLNQELEDRVVQRTAEIQESNEKLKTAIAAAEAANQAKSDFLANMSHELRTPLNHIIGFTELVREQHFGTLNDIQREYLTDVLNSSNHLLSLINDILDLSKVEAGKLELFRSEIELPHLLENCIVMVKEKAQKHRLRITTEFHAIPERIEGDNRKLKQILYNLLSNAVKFTPEGGRICIGAGPYPQHGSGPLELDASAGDACDNPYIEIYVMDTGIGLKPDDRERIFNPFEQANGSRKRQYQGTGLGLSLTRKLVDLHHGWIWAESKGLGSGSVFRMVIPCRQPQNGKPASASSFIPNECA